MITETAKNLSSNGHIEYSINTGKKGEENFRLACKLNNLQYVEATDKENIKHVDFYVLGLGVDVKGYKNAHKDGFLIVEFRNVNGNAGSCSEKSNADLLAFQFEDYFLIVRKDELLNYCRKEVKNEYVSEFKDCYKKLYTRKDRKDLMTKLHVSDLKTFNFIWKLKF